jgi:hypothetical protein
LAIWIGQLNTKNDAATDEVINKRVKMVCKYCKTLLY